MKKYLLYLYIPLFLSACGDANKAANEETAEAAVADTTLVAITAQQMKTAGIEVGSPEESAISGSIRLQGTIDVPPQSTVSVSFPLGGYLKSTDLLPGMHVRKGQVLGVLQDMQFIKLQQDYLTAKERFNLATNEYNRYQELNVNKAASDKVFQQSRAEMETQRINMQALAEKLQLIGINARRLTASNISKSVNILSPIDGFVAKVDVNIGKYTAPTDVLFELVNPKDIHLALNVFEKDVNNLSIGQRVIAYKNDAPDKRYEAEIILISKNLDADRMATVHCHFENLEPSLLPGMFMNAEVEVKNGKALTLNEDAIVRWQNNHYVFVDAGNNNFKMTKVALGNQSQGKQQIDAAGINNTTKLVTKNAYTLLMKLKNSGEEE
ncbi:hemolysin D [Pedobacter quisquiliarum]|uniref:Hemolysin D n=1 Tax=Pedobacter quisquiliarum TaxID=1834438 RepID=A0A916U7J7_9SPHI|nr:efflux RND transporter periplasmic adaptor subunit [Pedobacter quisquiliarum]GGC62668.1 hemolysin D [Pedobacter quisquiliarum]